MRLDPAPRAGLLRALAALTLVAALPADGLAAGAWQTHIRTKDFADLLVTDAAVYCATREAGLLVFDRNAHTFTSITREPGSISSNQVTSLALDRVGRLWVGTFASGVSRLSADGSLWELVNAFDGLPVDSVTTMTVAGDTLWIGTRGGVALWDGRQVLGSLPDGNTVSFDTTFTRPEITGIVQLGDTLWLSTPRGVGFARTSTNLSDWRKANTGLPTVTVDRLASDGRYVYALCAANIYRWDELAREWSSIGFIGNVLNLVDEHGTVMASTTSPGGGIWTHRAEDILFGQIAGSPEASGATGANGDPGADPTGSATLYVGGVDSNGVAGLWEHPAGGAWTFYPPPGPPGNIYANIIVQGSQVYAATRSEGVGRWDGSSWFLWPQVACNLPCPETFKNPLEVFALIADKAGYKWVGCWGYALERFDDAADPDVFEHRWDGGDLRHTYTNGAAVDSSGVVNGVWDGVGAGGVWFGMDSPGGIPIGLDYYDSTGTHVGAWGPNDPPGVSLVRGGKIRAVTVDKTGRVWIGYAGSGATSGVDNFIRRPQVGYEFNTVASTAGLDIWGLEAYGDSIWVLTDNDLRRINRTSVPPRVVSTLSTPTLRAPDAPSHHLAVAPDGSVWVGVVNGVRWYRPGQIPQDFTASNSPLASNDVRAVAVEPGGAVWFGTVSGLNRFDPGYAPPTLPPGVPDTLRVYPSPATLTGAGLQMRLLGTSAGYVGGIYDVRGRLVHVFTTTTRGQVFWDGRDRDGVLVKPGVYFLRADREGRQARARFVLLH